METPTRSLDLVVFGSTAFTGQLACHYLATHAGGVKWAVAGRNTAKLDELWKKLSALPHPPSARFVVDHSDQEKVRGVVSQTRVALSFAGPFGRYGESVVAACAELGTHYLDITGETLWVRDMIRKYEAAAQKSGAVLIPFSGFDSIPSDLGSWEVLRVASANGAKKVDRVVSLFSVRGGLNGGTYETMLDLLAREDQKDFFDPLLLVPLDLPREQRLELPQKDGARPVTVVEERLTAPPFFMAAINSRVVYRSQALRKLRLGEPFQPFQYVELLRPSRWFSPVVSWGMVLSGELLQQVGQFKAGREFLRRIGPKSGQGPSEYTREHGFFSARFYAYEGTRVVARCQLSYSGDPGNKATVMMACESALCLVDRSLPPRVGGFWTPSTALGVALRDRLARAGMEFKSLGNT